MLQTVDPAVSRDKFAAEIQRFREGELEQLARGVMMVRSSFPETIVAFGAPELKGFTNSIIFAARMDYTNFDLIPPSVTFVHPFTLKPYAYQDLPTRMPQAVSPTIPAEVAVALAANQIELEPTDQPLIQPPTRADGLPFLCLPGVREYHANAAHTGDPWLTYRGGPESHLTYLVDQLHKYGIAPLASIRFELQVKPAGFQVKARPR